MKIIIAPQAFKNCASGKVVSEAIARGIRRVLPNADIFCMPVADGGDGTLAALVETRHLHQASVTGALGERRGVEWGMLGETAIIESALICGMATLEKSALNPAITTTYGIGELIKEILDRGIRNVFIGLGGSATNDGGTGLAKALGARFLDAEGNDLPPGGAALIRLAKIDTSKMELKNIKIIAGCDVINPLLGPEGASLVYSPQKGASPALARQLEAAMAHYASIVARDLGIDISSMLRGGAAGGMASGLYAFCGAQLVSGAEWILQTIHFDAMVKDAVLVITGEGHMDRQTAAQKAPMAVAKAAKALNIPVIAIVGAASPGIVIPGIDAIFAASTDAEVPANAMELIENTAMKAMKSLPFIES